MSEDRWTWALVLVIAASQNGDDGEQTVTVEAGESRSLG